MWWIFLFFVVGIAAGFFANSRRFLVFSEYAVSWVVYFLLFLLGINTGSNEKLIKDFTNIGAEAFVISLSALIGSFVLALIWEKFICSEVDVITEKEKDKSEKDISLTGSLNVVFSFIAGILSGIFFKDSLRQFLNYDLITPTLYVLLFFVGSSIGSDRPILADVRNLRKKTLFFPFVTVSGTLIGSIAAAFLIKNLTVFDAMAVGSGFGYYSLSSVIIAGLKGDRLATIALVANITREVFTILLAPFIYSIFGKFALISSGGATSMDTTLPIILKFSGKKAAIISVYHGIILSILVPFLVAFFSGI